MSRSHVVKRIPDAIVINPNLKRPGYQIYERATMTPIGQIYHTRTLADLHANEISAHQHPFLFEDTKIMALLRYLLWQTFDSPDAKTLAVRGTGWGGIQDGWVPQPECSRVYGVNRYGRSDLYHRQAGVKKWIVFKDTPTGRVGKPRSRWQNGQYATVPGEPIVHRYWRWNLGTVEEYFKLLTNEQLEQAFVFCEDGMMHRVRTRMRNGQINVFENTGYNEGGKRFTSQDEWAKWLEFVNNEIKRRSFL